MDLRSIGGKSLPDPSSLKKSSSHLNGPKVLQTCSLFEKMLEEEHSEGGGPLHEEEEEDDVIVSDDDEGLREKVGKNKRKRKEEANAVEGKRGVCYLSRVPPRMEPLNLRRILSRFGDIQRIYLTPEDPTVQVRRKQAGGFRGKEFSEGWVEFTKKSVAKKIANMLNGEQMGGKRRSSFFYDTWNIKYLSNFKWDDLTSELANKNRTREQKLALELSAAKRERDFYLRKVDQSRALNAMQERKKKTRKAHEPPSGGTDVEEPKVIRKFPQNRPVDRITVESKSRLSKDFLSGVFGGS